MARRFHLPAILLSLLLASACDRAREEIPPAPSGTGVRLALLEPSDDMFLAALEGVLHSEGPCLYIVGDDRGRSRTLPAFHIADIGWDDAARTLRVQGRAFALGQRVVLGGGEPPNRTALPWVQRPHPSCDSSALFVAGTVEPAEAGGH